MEEILQITNASIIEPIEKIQGGNYIVIAVIMATAIILAPLIAKILVIIFGNRKKQIKESSLYRPVKITVYALGLYISSPFLGLPENIISTINTGSKVFIIMLLGYCLAKIISADSRIAHNMEERFNVGKKDTTGMFLTTVFKGIIFIVTGLFIFRELGYNLNGFMTSLGLTGVVVALAAQDFFKNLFGGLTIVMDKPFKVGDWVQMGGISGIVENINFRSTRLRTFNGTLAIIPNSVLSNENLICNKNLPYRKYFFTVTFPYDTPLEKVNNFIERAYQVLEETPGVMQDVINVNFDKISAYGIEMYIFVNTTCTVYLEYLKFKEMINFKIMELIRQEGIELAYNTQTIIAEGGKQRSEGGIW